MKAHPPLLLEETHVAKLLGQILELGQGMFGRVVAAPVEEEDLAEAVGEAVGFVVDEGLGAGKVGGGLGVVLGDGGEGDEGKAGKKLLVYYFLLRCQPRTFVEGFSSTAGFSFGPENFPLQKPAQHAVGWRVISEIPAVDFSSRLLVSSERNQYGNPACADLELFKPFRDLNASF